MLDSTAVRKDFPIYQQKEYAGRPLVYLDSTATSLKPRPVIDAISLYYSQYSANVFRGIYKMSEKATLHYEQAREAVARFIGAASDEIVFTRNTSESLNLVAHALVRSHFSSDSEIVTTILEHHSNFVPWQQMDASGVIRLKVWNCDKSGQLDASLLDTLVTRKTKLLTLTHVSNVVGTINPILEIVKHVKKLNPDCLVLVDAAQSAPHMQLSVLDLGADLVAFSGHKMLGPTGIGVLWGKKQVLEGMSPFLYGGDMIAEVHRDHTVFNSVPHKFEAGTPHIAGAIGLGEACEYLMKLGMDAVRAHERALTEYALERLKKIPDLTVHGPVSSRDRGGVLAFSLKGIHPHDVAQILDEDNICIRVGFHCAQPLHEHLGIGPTARASFYIYNTEEDVEALARGLARVKKVFS